MFNLLLVLQEKLLLLVLDELKLGRELLVRREIATALVFSQHSLLG